MNNPNVQITTTPTNMRIYIIYTQRNIVYIEYYRQYDRFIWHAFSLGLNGYMYALSIANNPLSRRHFNPRFIKPPTYLICLLICKLSSLLTFTIWFVIPWVNGNGGKNINRAHWKGQKITKKDLQSLKWPLYKNTLTINRYLLCGPLLMWVYLCLYTVYTHMKYAHTVNLLKQ